MREKQCQKHKYEAGEGEDRRPPPREHPNPAGCGNETEGDPRDQDNEDLRVEIVDLRVSDSPELLTASIFFLAASTIASYYSWISLSRLRKPVGGEPSSSK